MERISAKVVTGLKLGRRRKRRSGYKRITDVTGDRKSRFWRMPRRIKLRLKKLFLSPKKLLLRLRDAYVSMMLRIANSPMVGGFAGAGDGFGSRPLKEYDERMLIQIYKSMLISQSQLLPTDRTTVTPEN